jgi:phage gp29-like protein
MATKPKPDKRTLKRLAATALTLAYDLPVHGDWLDDEEIAKIENDATVLSSVSIRKATTLKKELLIESDNEEVAGELARIIDYNFRSQVLDTVLQGMGVWELNWYPKGFYYYPSPVERDYRSFALQGGRLHFDAVPVDELKAIHIVHRAKFNAPLGRPLYDTLFWLRRFKAASLEFWVEFLERFGHPWIIGKTDDDKDTMAEELYGMLGGDVAVIGSEDAIDLETPGDKGAFHEIVTYLDDQIREAIVGGNLTGNVQSGSYAAAKVHKEVSDDIAMADARLLEEAVAALIDRFKRLNRVESLPISFRLKDQDDPQADLAERDAKLAQAFGGAYRFDRDYLQETYKIRITPTGETRASRNRPEAIAGSKIMRFSAALPADEFDRAAGVPETAEAQEAIARTLEEIFADATSYEEAFDRLRRAFAAMDESTLLAGFEDYLRRSMLYGAAEATLEEREQGE